MKHIFQSIKQEKTGRSARGYVVLFLGLIISYTAISYFSHSLPQETERTEYARESILKARVSEILEEEQTRTEYTPHIHQTLKATIISNQQNGQTIEVSSQTPLHSPAVLKEGDTILIGSLSDETGSYYYVIDLWRGNSLVIAAGILFLALMLVIGKESLLSLAGLAVSFFVLIKLIVPFIAYGYPPVLITIIGACMIIPFTFFLAHGCSKKTTISVIATTVIVAAVSVLSAWLVSMSRVSGLVSEELLTLAINVDTPINIQGLLVAGIIISALGILDDVTISQASIVEQLHTTKTFSTFSKLYAQSMKVGRDHIVSAINTLVLVYAGASLPTLLLLTRFPRPLTVVLNNELLVIELLAALLSTLTIVLAIPLTTALAAYIYIKS